MTRKALGRGLGALLSAEGTATATEDANEIPIDLIDPSSLQPRRFLMKPSWMSLRSRSQRTALCSRSASTQGDQV